MISEGLVEISRCII